MDPHLEEWTGRRVHVQRGVLFWTVSEPVEQSELLLRNKAENKVEEPVFCKKAGKAQSVSTFYLRRRVHGFDWQRGSRSQVGSLESSGLCVVCWTVRPSE